MNWRRVLALTLNVVIWIALLWGASLLLHR